MNEDARMPPGVDPARPAPARIYDYLLSGVNNFQSDRDAAERIMALVPEVRDCAWANRGFHQRAARWIAGRGVRQFVDVGSGLPTVGNTHDVVRSVDANCRVVYVDIDPMVRAQSGQLLNGTSGVTVIQRDLRGPEHLLADPELLALIDFTQPAGLLMTAVMHFVADESDPWGLMAKYLDVLAPGSYVALSHLTSDHKPPRAVREFRRVFARATEQVHFRTRPDVERLFDGVQLVTPRGPEVPGHLCYVGDWEAEDADLADSDGSRWLYCGVALRRLPETPVPGTGGPGTRFRSRTQFRADVLPDFLDGPVVAVGIVEEDVLPAVPGGVQYLHRGNIDAPFGQLRAGRLEVRDDQLQAGRGSQVGAGRHHLGADHHRARRPGRGHVHHPHRLGRLGVGVEAESQRAGVEVLRPVDVGDRDHHNFQLPVHDMNPFGLPRPGGALAVGRSWGAGLDIDPAQAGKIPAPARGRLQPDGGVGAACPVGTFGRCRAPWPMKLSVIVGETPVIKGNLT